MHWRHVVELGDEDIIHAIGALHVVIRLVPLLETIAHAELYPQDNKTIESNNDIQILHYFPSSYLSFVTK